MRKVGGFFIWASFLFCGCVSSNLPDGNFETIDDLGTHDLGLFNFDWDKKVPVNYNGVKYHNNDLGISFSYPNEWQMNEMELLSQNLLMTLGNFQMDEHFHPEAGEILIEGLRFENDSADFEDWVYNYRQEKRNTRQLVFEKQDNVIRIVTEFGNVPESFEGEWLPGYLEDFYWQRQNEIFVFSALVGTRDAILLQQFETTMITLQFQEDGNER